MALLKEFCAENMTLVPAALAAGAKRIELCDNLAQGGTTPSFGVIRVAVAYAAMHDADVMVMIRPRGGDFFYTPDEAEIMIEDLRLARSLGVTGVVFGCLLRNEHGEVRLDSKLIKCLAAEAKGAGEGLAFGTPPVQITFHMAFDELDETAQIGAIDTLAGLGVERILTHGGVLGTPIEDNQAKLKMLIEYAAGRITILPGGGITWENAEALARELGVSELHGTKVVKL